MNRKRLQKDTYDGEIHPSMTYVKYYCTRTLEVKTEKYWK